MMRRILRALCVQAGMAVGASAALLAVAAPTAFAQVTKVEPYYIVVEKDAPVRADAGNVYYSVRNLKAGDVLRVDGENKGWLRVEYLAGMPAYVPAAEGELSADAKTLKLKTSSQLLAVDSGGIRPWWPLLEAPLGAGTSFDNPQPIKSADGTVEGYHVPAPSKARGWIAQSACRRATPAEAQKYTGPSGPPASPTSSATTPAATPPAAPTTSTTTTTTPVPPAVIAPAKPGETVTTKSTSPDGTTTTTTTTTEPTPPGFEHVDKTGQTTLKQTTTSSSTTTTTSTPAPVAQPAVALDTTGVPITKRISDIRTLQAIYDRGRDASSIAELNEIIREFEQSLAALSTADPKLLSELNKRAEALRLRRDLLDAKERSIAMTRTIDERTRTITLALADVQKQAVYTIVGTMLPSTVYDGSRGMPLLYRIDAPDTFSTRTVGYVVPRDGLNLVGKTGRVVGVIGDSKLDPALSVTIVNPSRIDVLNFVESRYVVESSETISSSTTTTTTTTTSTATSSGSDVQHFPPPHTPTSPTPTTETPAQSPGAEGEGQ